MDKEVNQLDKNKKADPVSMIDIDKILDEIPAERKGLRYADGWDPAHLDEELKKHPFFLKETPGEGEEVSPLVEALQQLKYSSDDNTPEELALNYKEDGLFHFKLKKYRIAVLCFTEGIKCLQPVDENSVQSCNNELQAQLYNNRAAAQFRLQNYRSALLDCDKACQFKPNYFKAAFKALECCWKLGKWDKVLEYCVKCEQIDLLNKEVAKYRAQATKKLGEHKAGERKGEAQKRAQDNLNKKIMNYIDSRNIKCRNRSFLTDDYAQHKVKIGLDDRLEWPVIFFYPQFSQNDFVESFHEDSTFLDHLTEILENERPPWDRNDEYHIDKVGVYFISSVTGGYVEASLNKSLAEILPDPRYELPSNGVAAFFIMNPDNEICKNFLERLQEAGDDS